jgi:hypothetical protein
MINSIMNFESLVGKTLYRAWSDHDSATFETVYGERFKLYHEQECCEDVYLAEIHGNLSDLLNDKILEASERTETWDSADQSMTATFYHISTMFASVTLRFVGTSNGYYSEAVDFVQISDEPLEP